MHSSCTLFRYLDILHSEILAESLRASVECEVVNSVLRHGEVYRIALRSVLLGVGRKLVEAEQYILLRHRRLVSAEGYGKRLLVCLRRREGAEAERVRLALLIVDRRRDEPVVVLCLCGAAVGRRAAEADEHLLA